MAHGAQGCLALAHFSSLILPSSCTILLALKDPPAQSLCLLVDVPSRQHNHQGTCLELSVYYGQAQHLRVPSIRSRRLLLEFSSRHHSTGQFLFCGISKTRKMQALNLSSHTVLCAREKVQKFVEDLFSFSSLLLLMRAATFQARACVNIFCLVSSNGSLHTVTSGLD